MSIDLKPVSKGTDNPNSITSRWGITANEYTLSGVEGTIDFQDLMVAISKKRAAVIESEVKPQATEIRNRNAYLDRLGTALADLTKIQAAFNKDATGDSDSDWLTNDTGKLMEELGYACKHESADDPVFLLTKGDFYAIEGEGYAAKKKVIEAMIQTVKSAIDGANNEAQLDMSRLQQIVDRRDESYSTATTLMTSISDTRSNTIRNF